MGMGAMTLNGKIDLILTLARLVPYHLEPDNSIEVDKALGELVGAVLDARADIDSLWRSKRIRVVKSDSVSDLDFITSLDLEDLGL